MPFIRPRLEVLEDRTLLSVNPDIVKSAFQNVLQNVQNSLTSVLSAPSLPLVGQQLGRIVNNVGNLLDNALDTSPNLTNAAPGTFEFPIHTQIQRSVNFDLGLGHNFLTLGSGDNGDVLTVNVTLDIYYLVHFGYDGNNQVTIGSPTGTLHDTYSNLPQNTLAVTLGVTLPGLNAAASLNGFLFVRAHDHTASPTALNVTFGVNPNGGSFSDTTLQGRAHVDLDLDLYLADPVKYANLPINPHLQTEFVLDWTFNTSDSNSLAAGGSGFSIGFQHLRLDVAGLVPGFLQEIIHDLQRVTKPLQPIVDVLNQEIPGLPILGIHERIRDLLDLPSGVNDALDLVSFINSLPDLTYNSQGNPNAPFPGFIDFGNFGLGNFGQSNALISALGNLDPVSLLNQATSDIQGLTGLNIDISSITHMDNGPPVGFAFPILTDPVGCIGKLLLGRDTDLFTYVLPTIGPAKGFSLGVNLGILQLTLNAFIGVNINASVGYDASGLIKLVSDIGNNTISGPVDVAKDLLHGFYVDNTPVPVLQAVSNNVTIPAYTRYATGIDVHGGISASAGLLGLNISGGLTAQGSLHLANTTDEFGQPRVHLDQIIAQITSDPLSLFAAHGNISLGLDLSYGFSTPFGSITLFSYNIAHVVLYDFELGRSLPSTPPPPANILLLHMTGQDQVISVHNFLNIRSVDRTSGTPTFYDAWAGIEVDYNPQPNGQALHKEFYYLSHTSDNDQSLTNVTTQLNSPDGVPRPDQPSAPINLVATDSAAAGIHTINISGNVYIYDTSSSGGSPPRDGSIPSEIDTGAVLAGDKNGTAVNAVLAGGAGDDKFIYHGGGKAILVGGGGNNYLEGGQAEFGGVVPLLHPGYSLPFTVPSSVPLNTGLSQPGGSDTLIGSAGDDILVGGGGTSFFDGMGGNDTEYGGGGVNQFHMDAGYTGSPLIYGGGTSYLSLSDDQQVFTRGPADSADIRMQADPSVQVNPLLPDLGQHALDINVINGPGIQAYGISTVAISTYGGPVSIQDLNSTSVAAVSIDSDSSSVTPTNVTVHGTGGNDTFALSTKVEANNTYSAEVTEGSRALPIVIAGLTTVDRIILDGGLGRDQLTLNNLLGIANFNFSSATAATVTLATNVFSYTNIAQITVSGYGSGALSHLILQGGSFANETEGYVFGTGYRMQLDGTTITASNLNGIDDLTTVTNTAFTGSSGSFFDLSDGLVENGLQTTDVAESLAVPVSVVENIRAVANAFGLAVKKTSAVLTSAQNRLLAQLATLTSTTVDLQQNYLISPLADVDFANKANVTVTQGWNSTLDTRLTAPGLTTLRIEPGDNRVAVEATAPGVAVTLAKTVAGSGTRYDIASATPGVGVQDIRGPINITDTYVDYAGRTVTLAGTILNVDDSGDPMGQYVGIGGVIHQLAPADIRFADARALDSVTVTGGDGGNTFVISTAAQGILTLNAGAGNDTVLVNAYVTTRGYELVVDGGPGYNYLGLSSFKASTLVPGGGGLMNGHYYSLLYVGRVEVTYARFQHVSHPTIGQVDGFIDLSGLGTQVGIRTGGPSTLRIEGQPFGDDTVLLRYDPGNPTLLQATVDGVVQYDGPYVNLQNMTIDTGLGQDTVTIQDLPAGVSLLIADLGTAVVNLGNAGSLQSIQGSVNVVNTLGSTALTIDDSADATARNVSVTSQTITGLAQNSIAYAQLGLSALNVRSGGGAISVPSTPSNGTSTDVTTHLSVGGGSSVTIGNRGSLAGIQGNLFLEFLAAGAVVNLDDSADRTNQAVLLDKPNQTTYRVTGFTSNPILLAPLNLNSLTVSGGSGTNTYTVAATPAGTAVILGTGAGADTTNVGNAAGRLDDIAGPLTINGPGRQSTLNVNDQRATGVASYVVSAGLIARTGAAPIGFRGITSLLLNEAASGNTTSVVSTSAAVTTTIDAGNGNDIINVADSNNRLDGIQGALIVNGRLGRAVLNLNDQGDSAAATYTVTAGAMARTGTAPVSFGFLHGLVLNAGSGATTINVQSTDINAPTTVNTGSGATTVNVGASTNLLRDIGTLNINGGSGGTTGVNLDDQANADGPIFLMVRGTLQTRPTYLITDHSVVRTDAEAITQLQRVSNSTVVSTITYQNLAALTLNGGAAPNIFNVQSTAAGTPITINTGKGPDVVNVGDANNTLDGLLGPLTVVGRKNTALNVSDQGTTADKTYSLTSTTLTRAAYPPPDSGGQQISYSALGSLVLHGGNGNNLFGVTGTPKSTAVTLFGGTANSDQFVLGNNSNLDSIQGGLTLHGLTQNGQAGYSFVVLNDFLNAVGHTYTLSSTKLQRTGISDVSYDGLDELVLYGGTATDTFNVTGTAPATPVVITANSRTTRFNVASAAHNVTAAVA